MNRASSSRCRFSWCASCGAARGGTHLESCLCLSSRHWRSLSRSRPHSAHHWPRLPLRSTRQAWTARSRRATTSSRSRTARGSPRTEIPPDRSTWGVVDVLAAEAHAAHARSARGRRPDRTRQRARHERQVGDYYASYIDEAAIEASGMRRRSGRLLDRIAAIDSATRAGAGARRRPARRRRSAEHHGLPHRPAVRLLDRRPTSTTRRSNAAYLLQGGLGLPDRDYYLGDSARNGGASARSYATHVARCCGWPAIADPDGKAGAHRRAREQDRAGARDADSSRSTCGTATTPGRGASSRRARRASTGTAFFARAPGSTTQPVVIVWHPQRDHRPRRRWSASEPLDAWKDWLTFHAIDRNAARPPERVRRRALRLPRHGPSAARRRSRQRWKRAVDVDQRGARRGGRASCTWSAISRGRRRTELQTMVANIVAAFGRRIDALDWMTPATKAKAREKLTTLQVGVGYPDTWMRLLGARRRARRRRSGTASAPRCSSTAAASRSSRQPPRQATSGR